MDCAQHIYTECTGRVVPGRDRVCLAREVRYTVESSLIRPADEVETYPEITRIRDLGYVPKYDMKQTMYDLLEFWRSRQHKAVVTGPADIGHAAY